MNPGTLFTPTPTGTDWQCLQCESGTGSAPRFEQARIAATTHAMAAHQPTVETPRRRRWSLWRPATTTPRRAEQRPPSPTPTTRKERP